MLKDEETRKTYDKYGEEGLKDGGGSRGRYESYNYYQNEFGIYDDDPEIVTLDGSDFGKLHYCAAAIFSHDPIHPILINSRPQLKIYVKLNDFLIRKLPR